MGELTWKKFNKAPVPTRGGASSRSHPRETEQENDKRADVEVHSDSENSEAAKGDGLDDVFDMIGELSIRITNIQRVQNQMLVKQREQREEFHRHQHWMEDVARYQMVVNAYMLSGQQGDPPTFSPPHPLPHPDQP